MNWLPIESAPKDGTHIILGKADDEDEGGPAGFVGEGYYMEEDHDGPDNMGHDAGFVDLHFNYFSCPRSFGNPVYQSKGTQPTHWMPLPQSPKTTSRALALARRALAAFGTTAEELQLLANFKGDTTTGPAAVHKPPAVWPFPSVRPPVPLTKKELLEDEAKEREALGEALF